MKRLLAMCAVLVLAFSGCEGNMFQSDESRSGERMQRLSKPLPYLAQVFGRATKITQMGPMMFPEDAPTQGSAFVYIDEKGRCGVYTADHLMNASEKTAWVRMDGEKTAVEVPVISRDSLFDMAVLQCPKLPGTALGSVTLGSAEDVFVGREVFTVGFPHSTRSVTNGYINSADASQEVGPHLFSHQGPLLPGDSGGISVVFNDRDEPLVIGMNTVISQVGARSYSISVRYLRRIMEHLWKNKPGAARLIFGATIADISMVPPRYYIDSIKKPYPPPGNVVVIKVERETPAESAGLKEGDAIIGARHPGGAKISFATAEELLVGIFLHTPGETILFSIIRDGKPLEAAVTFRAREEE